MLCCWRERAARAAAELRRVLRALGGVAGGCTTTGSSIWTGLADCAQPSVDNTKQENATDRSNARRCRGAKIVREVINRLAITWHVTANAAWLLPQEDGSPTPTRTPRPMCSRVTTTDGRSPGSRVVTCRRLPRPAGPSGVWRRLAAYSCGGSHGVGDPRTVFPIDLPKENRRSHPSFICKRLSTACLATAEISAWHPIIRPKPGFNTRSLGGAGLCKWQALPMDGRNPTVSLGT